jgi:hypothetical protein
MAIFPLSGVLRGFPAAAYRKYASPKTACSLCGLAQRKNGSFMNWTPIVLNMSSWMGTNLNNLRSNAVLALRVSVQKMKSLYY